MKGETYVIKGMHCASCAVRIEGALQKVDGVREASVNYALGEAFVNAPDVPVTRLEQVVKGEGYELVRVGGDVAVEHHAVGAHAHAGGGVLARKELYLAIGSMVLSLPVVVLAMFVDVSGEAWVEAVLTLIIVFGAGWSIHWSAFRLALRGRVNMDSLISLGTVSATAFSLWAWREGGHVYFETASVIIAFILLGRYLEALSKGRAGEAVRRLLELGAKEAHVVEENGVVRDVGIEMVKVGDVVLVKPGEKVPLDGEIIDGASTLDESMLTGESVPVQRGIGEKVFGATVNQKGMLKVRVERVAGETILAQIAELVRRAQSEKAPVQKMVDKVAGVFVPIVVVVAVVTFVIWWFVGGSLEGALIPAVAVLVIACPCALGLATPTAILVGTGRGAEKGIFIKSGEALERGKAVTVAMLDKTGTLTEGKPVVTDVYAVGEWSEKDVLMFAGAVEQYSEHPLANAVVEKSKELSVESIDVEGFEAVVGNGVRGMVNGQEVKVGKSAFVGLKEVDARSGDLERQSKTVIYVSVDGEPVGLLAIRDAIKSGAIEAVQSLKSMGIEPVMLTGDNKATAEAIAKELNIDRVHAEILPEDKLTLVKREQDRGKKVAFAGDGINDAPAITQADLGIAMGTGTDIAIEAGQIVIMNGNPGAIPEAIAISRATLRGIKQNLFWAFIYNTVGIPLAGLGLLNPMIAGGAMAFSSVSVVLNSLRLRRS